jgi:transcriptional antiterminator NusG
MVQVPSATAEEVPPKESTSSEFADSRRGKWYVIHSQTGHEERVKKNLQQRVESLGVSDRIYSVVVPTRETVVVKRGKKTKQAERVFPGYILVQMELDDQTWLVVRTTEGVTGFIGVGQRPTPISQKEVDAIMRFVSQDQPKYKAKFVTGEAVKIIDGPFTDFLGSVQSMDESRGKLTVLVSIFDRETPIELDFLQVQKL